MFFEANQARFLFSVPGLPAVFQVLRFHGEECISQSFDFSITLVCEDPALDLAAFLSQPCTLSIKTPEGYRAVTGVVHGMAQGDSGLRLTEYLITLRPRLALLRHRVNYRIFQQLSVRQIVEKLLQEAQFTSLDYHWRLHEKHPLRDYCVQYAESDYDFIHRLLAEEGIHYHYEVQNGHSVLVLGDGNFAFPAGVSMKHRPASGLNADKPALRECQTFWHTVAGKVTGRDFTFTRPLTPLQAEITPLLAAKNEQTNNTQSPKLATQPLAVERLEDYRWPMLSDNDADTLRLSQLAQARHNQAAVMMNGVTDHSGLITGKFATFNDLPRREFEPLWLVKSVRHEGEQPQVLEETSGGQASYRNHFTAMPWQSLFVPPCWHKRPTLSGYQTAIVTGPKGEEIYTDELGRIKVQFHWDRAGQGDEKTSCWLRLAQSWAGDRYGSHWIPRVGQEVVVSFEHGNPDRPLVLGCVYNGANHLPYELPIHKSRSVFKTLSTPGGGGFNELRFEDKKGHEQIYLHAQRDWELMVKANAFAVIDGDSHRLTHGNAIERVKGDRQERVKQDSFEHLKANDQLKLNGMFQHQVDQSFLVSVSDELHQNAAIKINLEAGAGLTLKVGGSFITISAAGVQMVAPSISLNGGAAPLVGTPLTLLDAMQPIGAVMATARKKAAAASKLCRARQKK
nr:type VI secretion system tip protein TssI/VgrG [uncultured Tolumonas sp.]